mmetsp:Transcript_50841/g.164724  ORF Transcript_50841/g.164724 Transcript_50841/m.164724 type:complete len:157 (+) Transcript_50841:189-659(+)
MEYDAPCANEWARRHPHVAHVHTGDQSSAEDLMRVIAESGGGPFDVIIDDGSHMNHHQIASAKQLLPHVAAGGVYVIEDILSACTAWRANLGGHTNHSLRVSGTRDCMVTEQGEPTILAQLVDWQKQLAVGKTPFPGVRHIEVWQEAAVIERESAR